MGCHIRQLSAKFNRRCLIDLSHLMYVLMVAQWLSVHLLKGRLRGRILVGLFAQKGGQKLVHNEYHMSHSVKCKVRVVQLTSRNLE